MAGRSRGLSPNTHTHTAHPCQEWLGASGACTRAHTHPNTPARSGRAQPEPKPNHTLPHRTPMPGEAGYKRPGSSDCPRPSLRLITVVTRCSLGIFGSSSHASGRLPVQTVPGGTWLVGVRSCTGHSRNGLSSQSSRFWVSTFSPHSGSACHAILSCRLPRRPGVASLPFILPRNHTNCFGCPLSVAPNTPCTFAPSGHSGCMALRSATVKNGHTWGSGFGCGLGGGGTGADFGAGLGCLARRAGMPAPSGRDLGLGRAWSWFRRIAVVEALEDAVCRSLALPGSVHTSKFVRLLLQVGVAMFESLFRVRGPGHPASRL